MKNVQILRKSTASK